jgi:putative endonuclease
MTKRTKSLGNKGEAIALRYLIKKNYQILDKNYRTRYGEIDIIAKHGDYVVLVEVKTKTTIDQGTAEEMVNKKKQKKLLLLSKLIEQKYTQHNIRIDVVAIDTSGQKPIINHLINAVT